MSKKYFVFVPVGIFSFFAILHNAFLILHRSKIVTGYPWLDWSLAFLFALGIEAGLWALLIHKKAVPVKMYVLTLFVLNCFYYGRGRALQSLVDQLAGSGSWEYVEDIGTALIFAGLLSYFTWFLTEIIIKDFTMVSPPQQKVKRDFISGPEIYVPSPVQQPQPEIIPPLPPPEQPTQAPGEPVTLPDPVPEKSHPEGGGSYPPKLSSIVEHVNGTLRECLHCGELYSPKVKNQLYCKASCKEKSKYNRKKQNIEITLN